MDESKSTVAEILAAEAEGYILKHSDKKELINAINRIMDKASYYSSSIMQILGELVRSNGNKESINSKSEILSEREIEVVKLICEELTSEEIAQKLFLSKFTVDVHRKNIIRKLEAKGVIGIYKYAIDNSII
jgi:DNA-binding NarL/FixJ family response regulator